MQEHGDTASVARRLTALVRSHPWRFMAVCASIMLVLGAALAGIVDANVGAGDIIVSTQDEPSDGRLDEDDDSTADESGDDADGDMSDGSQEDENTDFELLTVDVDGAVARPAVIQLPEGSRVQDAIEACGGLAADADVSGINRAARLQDGQKVFVPQKGQAGSAPSSPGAGAATGGTLVNINVATVDELDSLPGIGEATALAIIEEREANGAFASIEDLMRVSGVGEKKFEKLRDLICV